ncbi:MAG: glucosyl transferase, partial [Bacteroidota bacterium]|nr:glucosyl transferase [Bacteroidota bacterium]
YTYRAELLTDDGKLIHRSEPITVTTMDTTSHDFSWDITYLGDGASSVLRDVCIINDTCVWAVGEINCKDSLGNWMSMYNAARWDGKKWHKFRIPFLMNYGTSVFIDSTTSISSVYAPLSNDVWFCNGAVTRLVNNSWMKMNFLLSEGPGRANKMWGTSSNNMYFVADLGRITHWNGVSWRRLESGTTLDIQDIWGGKNEKTGLWEVLAVAGNYYISNERKILHISGTNVTALSDSGINWALNGVWFSRGKRYWVVGTGIWEKPFSLKTSRWKGGPNIVTTYTTNAIRGTEINNVFICGAFGEILHFNGISWQSFHSRTALSAGQYLSIAVQSNTVYAVGYQSPRAVVARGLRHIGKLGRR